MNSTKLFLCFVCTFAASFAFTQGHERCAHEYLVSQRQISQPDFNRLQWVEKFARTSSKNSSMILTIPVIFHIVHDGTPVGVGKNVSTAQVMAQLDQLNLDYRRNNPDRVNTPAIFLPDAADVEIEFCLAMQDTAGFPTSGIRRYNFGIPSYTPDEFKHIVQSRTTWDRDRYLNIWITDLRGYLGYAFLPGGEAIGDGMVLDYITVGSLAQPNPFNSTYRFGRTATHELAHWLGLDHHWAVQDDCTADDGVPDTPKQFTFYLGCPAHPQTSCSSTDMFMNFLDYTDDACMNLFTKGQKSVMRGVLQSSRSGLLSSSGCTTVQPVIMFRQTQWATYEGNQKCTETSSNTFDIWLDIAKAPSRTAIVNVAVSGNADQGKDYNLSSTTVTFPQGQSNSQRITLTIHSDGSLEGIENIVLTLSSIQSNGGDAKLGSSNQQFNAVIVSDDFDALPFATTATTIGTETSRTTNYSPFHASTPDHRMQMIYRASEMIADGLKPGRINAVNFFVSQKLSAILYTNFTLKLGLTSKDKFELYDAFITATTTVHQSNLQTVAGKTVIPLQTNYFWDGQSNLVVECCYDNASASNDDEVRFQDTGPDMTVLREFQNGTPGCNINFIASRHSIRPLIEVEMEEGRPIAVDVNSHSGYAEFDFGPLETVHFYDRSSNNLMLSLKNNSGFDYGCTKVEIDNSGNSAIPLWSSNYDRTSKTFLVTPEFNNASGSYEVSVYYTNDEITGWEQNNRLMQSRSSLHILKCDNTVGGSNSSQCQIHTSLLSSFGGDYKWTANINSGFSGFTLANIPAGPLSLNDLFIEGERNQGRNVVNVKYSGNLDFEKITLYRREARQDDFSVMEEKNHSSNAGNIFIDYDANKTVYYRARLSSSQNEVWSNIISIENNHSGISVFPTVVSETLQISSTQHLSNIEVFDINGKIIIQRSLNSPTHSLNASDLPSGTYYYRVTTSQSTKSGLFIRS